MIVRCRHLLITAILMMALPFPVSAGQPASVVLSGDTIPLGSFDKKLTLNHNDNNIIFLFPGSGGNMFRFYLEGLDGKPSEWRKEEFKEYTNLPSGRFVFHTNIRDGSGNISELPGIQLHILPPWYLTRASFLFYFLFLCLASWAVYNEMNLRFARRQFMLEQIINKRTEDLIIEKEKSEALLANVLPKNTASEIMSKGKATKIKYNFVTVLFSDIQGFTKIAEEMNPEVLIDELDKFFFYFDSVVEKYGIEKIKTIGDAYMCAGGIPEKNRTNPVEVILAALEMKAYMKRLKESSELHGMKYWDIRIGIHTGTVIAGVVGQKKLSYDIWGDTVNTASRMESSGEAGKINISGTTYEFVKEFFTCEYRGKMPVKYKGELEMYFVNGIVPGLCDENGEPNSKFKVKMQMIKLMDVEEVVIRLFDEEASPNLYFHNSSLVRNIANQVELLANSEKLEEEDFIILKLAAIFLFTGYMYDYENPADSSVRLMEELMPGFGLSQADIDAAARLIRNSYGEKRETLSDSILHDARYDYLGRVDYNKLTEKLFRELSEYGKLPQKNWTQLQKALLRDHEFITSTARLLRDVPAEDQIASIVKK
ncbi:MAG TPA: adenylate/guanylate cyclase domain-containing protein [Bacteroidales bacterium]|nr:adenylate/guanylate cyclase domain-containing protein [Bacteroidales bacterium]